jgi:hypothetical protein
MQCKSRKNAKKMQQFLCQIFGMKFAVSIFRANFAKHFSCQFFGIEFAMSILRANVEQQDACQRRARRRRVRVERVAIRRRRRVVRVERSISRANSCSTWNILQNIVVALFPCMCYILSMNKASYLRAVGALRARAPRLCRAALVHASLVVPPGPQWGEWVFAWLSWRAVARFCRASLAQGVPFE